MSFILKNIVTNEQINFWNFINFFKQLLPSKPRAILHFIKDKAPP